MAGTMLVTVTRSAATSSSKRRALKARISTVLPPTWIIASTVATSPIVWLAGTARSAILWSEAAAERACVTEWAMLRWVSTPPWGAGGADV